MSFIEDVKNYLERVRRSDVAQVEASPVVLEPDWIRAEVIHVFERLEQAPSSQASAGDLARTFHEWASDDVAVRFASYISTLLQRSFLRGARREEVENYVRLAIARQFGLPDRAPSRTRELELDRLSAFAWLSSARGHFYGNDAWESIPAYALEIRATRRAGDHVELTPIGNVLLSLTGRDAVQWLLNVEVAQSTGTNDDWRLSRETAVYLLEHSRKSSRPLFRTGERAPHSGATLRRLEVFGLLAFDFMHVDGEQLVDVKLTDAGQLALEALIASTGTPFSILAATLSQDESLSAIENGPHRALVEAGLGTSALATARQARLVAHEIRNALIPAQVALSSLYGALADSSAETEITRFRPRIDPGINRVLKFVNDLLKTSELATRPPEAFNLVRALVDAKSSITTSLGIGVNGSMDLPSVLGYRERFVLAVVNLLRNAEQAGAKNVDITVTREDDGQHLLLLVDDDGPGVATEHRERIFQRGVTLRTGGAGEGLALVKEVIEFELRGKIACVDKPGGGARFQMRLPVAERSLR